MHESDELGNRVIVCKAFVLRTEKGSGFLSTFAVEDQGFSVKGKPVYLEHRSNKKEAHIGECMSHKVVVGSDGKKNVLLIKAKLFIDHPKVPNILSELDNGKEQKISVSYVPLAVGGGKEQTVFLEMSFVEHPDVLGSNTVAKVISHSSGNADNSSLASSSGKDEVSVFQPNNKDPRDHDTKEDESNISKEMSETTNNADVAGPSETTPPSQEPAEGKTTVPETNEQKQAATTHSKDMVSLQEELRMLKEELKAKKDEDEARKLKHEQEELAKETERKQAIEKEEIEKVTELYKQMNPSSSGGGLPAFILSVIKNGSTEDKKSLLETLYAVPKTTDDKMMDDGFSSGIKAHSSVSGKRKRCITDDNSQNKAQSVFKWSPPAIKERISNIMGGVVR